MADFNPEDFTPRGDLIVDEEVAGREFLGYSTFYDGAVTIGVWVDRDRELPESEELEVLEQAIAEFTREQIDDYDEYLPYILKDKTLDDFAQSDRRGAGYPFITDAIDYITTARNPSIFRIIRDKSSGLWYVVVIY